MGVERAREYVTITETPVTRGSREQLARLYSRYRFALDASRDGDVLEVACGAGLGLGYLSRHARSVTGGDIDEDNLRFARSTYGKRGNIEILKLDAEKLPFSDGNFDVVLLYEAIYYLPRPELFVREARRVLRSGGRLIVCSANKEWDEFNPSPLSRTYFSASELYDLLTSNLFRAEMYGECPVETKSARGKLTGMIKKIAVRFHLMPKTMKGKELLKRMFFGKLVALPAEITEGMSDYIPPVLIAHDKPCPDYKVVFAVGTKE